ncbi:hypothetical protein ACFZBP_37895 [Streptomyces sp. NPDC008086]|uniref:hypothetical protein n=1 Tax=Streptomyces sp. NPDC008086 TaxID=3364807 RepID=UPI0036EC9A54
MDLWPNIISAASALLGATVGVVATLLGERWRTRLSVLQEQRLADARLRDERKDVLLRFFAAVRPVERLAEQRWDGQELHPDEASELTSTLWLCRLEVELLCSPPVWEAAHSLTLVVTDAVWVPPSDRTHLHFSDKRNAVIAAARVELGAEAGVVSPA